MLILEKWKRNIQSIKWETVSHSTFEYSNVFLDEKIRILTDFFHPDEFDINKIKAKNLDPTTDPSSFWLIYILSQKNLGSFKLVCELCDIIKFFQKHHPSYLASKLLTSLGRISKRSFRNSIFEVWLNYQLIQNKINVRLDECYRSPTNPDSMGNDSVYNFKGNEYLIECLKLSSWKEENLSNLNRLITGLYKYLKKHGEKPILKTHHIYAIPTIYNNSILKEFKDHLNAFFRQEKVNNNRPIHKSSSRAFKEISIFEDSNSLVKSYERIYKKEKNMISIRNIVLDVKMLNELGNVSYNINDVFTEQRLEYQINSKCKVERSPEKFEEHLLSKLKKKIRQHRGNKNRKLIVAIELEKFKGLNNFPIESINKFKKLERKITDNTSIIIFYKDSSQNDLIIKSQALHLDYEPFFKFMNSR